MNDVFKMTSTATSFNYESNKYTMRKSTDERMKEILETNKTAAESSKVITSRCHLFLFASVLHIYLN